MNRQAARLLRLIEDAAQAGERMPENDQLIKMGLPAPANLLMGLTQDGHIRREIGGHNFRVVEIMTGKHKGLRTYQPGDWKAYRILEQDKDQTPIRSNTNYVSRDQAPVTLPKFSWDI